MNKPELLNISRERASHSQHRASSSSFLSAACYTLLPPAATTINHADSASPDDTSTPLRTLTLSTSADFQSQDLGQQLRKYVRYTGKPVSPEFRLLATGEDNQTKGRTRKK
ncbi:hypothetical protein R1flu_017522 [Riccia fluitans]|uniref:Uncharacterized protein n=1 Tax=Riccia fluitans TaxID=41844 RepID=A0ABD1ZD79_9MARC